MAVLDPDNTTVSDICTAALQEAGVVGMGQTPNNSELLDAQARLQWMLQQWNIKRYLVYRLASQAFVSTGADNYFIGPGADFNSPNTRPDKIENIILRQNVNGGLSVDYPVKLLQAKEDYANIALKGMKGFTTTAYYEPDFPNGVLFLYPIPLAAVYTIVVTYKLPILSTFTDLTSDIVLPYAYFWPLVTNLALALMNKYGMRLSPGNTLPTRAKDGLATLRASNTQIPALRIPSQLRGGGRYNIFSDNN
jgi:hypothetical protein